MTVHEQIKQSLGKIFTYMATIEKELKEVTTLVNDLSAENPQPLVVQVTAKSESGRYRRAIPLDKYQELMNLANEKGNTEIAEHFGVSVKTIDNLLWRLKKEGVFARDKKARKPRKAYQPTGNRRGRPSKQETVKASEPKADPINKFVKIDPSEQPEVIKANATKWHENTVVVMPDGTEVRAKAHKMPYGNITIFGPPDTHPDYTNWFYDRLQWLKKLGHKLNNEHEEYITSFHHKDLK